MSAPAAIRAAFNLTVLWLGFFAGWSLGSIPLTLACAPFQALWLAFGTGLVGAGAAILLLRKPLSRALLAPVAQPAGPDRALNRTDGLLFGSGLLAVAVSGVVFILTSNAWPLWGVIIAFGAAALWRREPPGPAGEPMPSADGPSSWIGLAVLILVILGLYLVILRPDADDAFYLNLPIGIQAAQSCMMAADTMYGVEGWPILGSNYRAEALPTLIAALSWATNLPVITVAHLLVPSIWCIVWATTLAVIGHGLFGRRWLVFAALAVIVSMVFAGTLQTWGVHGIARMFHGKAPLILIVFPLIAYVALRTSASRCGFAPTFAALFGLGAVSLGLTANAIYLAPLVIFLSVFSTWLAGFERPWRQAGLVLAAAPPVAAGLWLLRFDRPVSADPHSGQQFSTDLAFWDMAGDKTTLVLLVATLVLAAAAGRIGPQGRWVSAYLVTFFAIAINPLLWPLYDRFVTGGLTVRMWWALPLPLFLATALTWAILRSGRMWPLATVIAGCGFTGLVLLPNGLIGMNETELRPSIHKVPPGILPVVRDVMAAAPPDGTVLAPEAIAAWLPVWEGHPALVYSRRLYLKHSITVVDKERLSQRQLLADWIAGDTAPPSAEMTRAMSALNVQLVLLPAKAPPRGAERLLRDLDATPDNARGGYVLYRIPSWTD